MQQYKVLKECIDPIHVELAKPGDVIVVKEPCLAKDAIILAGMKQHGFIEPIETIDYKQWEEDGYVSKLAQVIIAPEDYVEGGKKYFTFDEAVALGNKLANGWRVPTRHQWALISEEFANDEYGRLNSELLQSKLKLKMNGYRDLQIDICLSGLEGNYWSITACPAASDAYYQNFSSANVCHYSSNRANGFSVRLVKDLERK